MQVEINSSAIRDKGAKFMNFPDPPATVGSQIFKSILDKDSSIMSCPENLINNNMSDNKHLSADFLSCQMSLGEFTAVNSSINNQCTKKNQLNGKHTPSHMKVSNDQCHGCTSLDTKLHQLRVYFQSQIDSLNEKF